MFPRNATIAGYDPELATAIASELKRQEDKVDPLERQVEPVSLCPTTSETCSSIGGERETHNFLSTKDDDAAIRKEINDDAERQPQIRKGKPREEERKDVVLVPG